MIFKAIVEYDYPTEHKPPIKAEIVLHGDRVVANIKPFEQKTGRWIKVTNGRGGHECDMCHVYAPSYTDGDEHLSAFCPNCGAKMEVEENG